MASRINWGSGAVLSVRGLVITKLCAVSVEWWDVGIIDTIGLECCKQKK